MRKIIIILAIVLVSSGILSVNGLNKLQTRKIDVDVITKTPEVTENELKKIEQNVTEEKQQLENVENKETQLHVEEQRETKKEVKTNPVVEDKKPVQKTEIQEETKSIEMENKQELIPVVDEEYERLMSQVEYSIYEECMEAGFKIASQDTVNIYGFSCPYIVYKGEILGYRLQIEYSNPMD